MKHSIFFLLLVMLPILAVSQENNTPSTATQRTLSKVDVGQHPKLPNTSRIPVTDTYFGMKVVDNYRWLENLKDHTVLKWLKAQSEYTNSYLDDIPGRDSLFEDFKRLDALKPATISDIQRKDGRYFFLKTLAHHKTAKLYYRNGENGKDILLFDPRADGSEDNITMYLPDPSGKKVAVEISKGGGEIGKISIINVKTQKLYPEKLGPTWGGIFGWSKNGKGLLYMLLNGNDTKNMQTLMNTKAMYHKIGTDPSEDKLILSKKKYPNLPINKEDACVVEYSEDYQYIYGIPGNVNNDAIIFYAPASELLKPHIHWKTLATLKDEVVGVSSVGDKIFLLTHKDAPKFKIIETNLKNPDLSHAKVIVTEGKEKIASIARSKDYLFINYSDGINGKAKKYNWQTSKLTPVKYPYVANAALVPFDIKTNDGLIYLTSWKRPVTTFDYNGNTDKTQLSGFNIKAAYPGLKDLRVVETEARNYDGTMVPLSIIYNKNVKLDGSANCLLRGYGAYGMSITPVFSTMNLALLNRGIVLAFAHVRGGGEKGEAWHKAGYKTTKPNTWKDFMACAEYLIQHKYTSASKLTGMGTSAGGITIGRAITARPDLFGAAIDNVGVTNALRAETTPTGPNNIPEFGTVKDSVQSRALYEMDALHHVKKGVKYPAVICVGGMNDPRVLLWQPAKFAAKLQWATASDKPILLDVNYDNGHFTQDKSVTFKNFANMISFALWQTGNPEFQLRKNH